MIPPMFPSFPPGSSCALPRAPRGPRGLSLAARTTTRPSDAEATRRCAVAAPPAPHGRVGLGLEGTPGDAKERNSWNFRIEMDFI